MPEIKGYRELTTEELELINVIKEHEASTAALMERVQMHLKRQHNGAGLRWSESGDLEIHLADAQAETDRLDRAQPQRWASMARTDFQTAYMKLVRAVGQPESPL